MKLKKTARTLLEGPDGRFYLAVHRYRNPANKGKWSTIGGTAEPFDKNIDETLHRELLEELSEENYNNISIIQKVNSIQVDGKEHIFFYCKISQLLNISLLDRTELHDVQLFTLPEIKKLQEENKLFFGNEYDLISQVSNCLLYTSPSPRDQRGSRMPSSA